MTDFDHFLRERYRLTYRQFRLLDAEIQIALHAEWLELRGWNVFERPTTRTLSVVIGILLLLVLAAQVSFALHPAQ